MLASLGGDGVEPFTSLVGYMGVNGQRPDLLLTGNIDGKLRAVRLLNKCWEQGCFEQVL